MPKAKYAGAIAAGHGDTVAAARMILEAGGNAFDAALAALAASCVAEPVLASLGGGGFMLARRADAPEQAVVYDFFAHTPRTKQPTDEHAFFPILADFGTATQEFHIGAGSVATPGMGPGLFAIHRDLCHMPLGDILAPAIAMAREGVVVNDFQAYLFGVVAAIYQRDAASLACFGSPGGGLAKAGETMRNPQLADAFEALGREGEALLRTGEIAQAMVRISEEHSGHLRTDDLAQYRVERRTPLSVTYRGARLLSNPAPSSGGILIGFALRLLEDAGITPAALSGDDGLLHLARVMDKTNDARIRSGLNHGAHDAVDRLLDADFLTEYSAHILGRPTAPRGTTHISIVDGEGNAAALTLSNGEGCGAMVPGMGFMLNNMLGEEDINPLGFNNWPTNERLCSMMAPSMIEHGDGDICVLGSGGSNRIRTALLQVIINMLDRGMELRAAVEAPRMHVENARVNVEAFFALNEMASLEPDFQNIVTWDDRNMFFGGVHAVHHAAGTGRFEAVGDPRRGGALVII